MTCIAPPELTDLQLSMYLDGDADASIHSHLIRCAHCRTRAIELASVQNEWRISLHRGSCPDSDTLRDYHFGFLSGRETGVVEEHLHLCPYCTHHVSALREFIAEPAWDATRVEEAVGVLQRIRWFVADLLQGGSPLAPELVGLRGAQDGSTAAFEAGEYRIDVAARVDPVMAETRILVGSILGSTLDEEARGWSADLWLGHEWIATAAVDDLGSFRFDGLAPGRYEIIVNGPGLKVRLPVVAVE